MPGSPKVSHLKRNPFITYEVDDKVIYVTFSSFFVSQASQACYAEFARFSFGAQQVLFRASDIRAISP